MTETGCVKLGRFMDGKIEVGGRRFFTANFHDMEEVSIHKIIQGVGDCKTWKGVNTQN